MSPLSRRRQSTWPGLLPLKALARARPETQASIQGDAVRVQGAKRDELQDCIALIRKEVTDFPIKAGNFRD